jgi:hypothetical protein
MDSRKYLLIVVITLVCCVAKAQVTQNLEQVDTTLRNFYKAGDWKGVITLGQKAIDSGIDFPVLRQELGYAYFISGNYSRALESYNKILGNDSRNPIAGYYSYLSGKYLNHDLQASFYASKLDSNQRKDEKIAPFSPLNMGFEIGNKDPEETYRSNAVYYRISETNRLSWRLQLEQSYLSFSQSVNNPVLKKDRDDRQKTITNTDRQFEYYAKLSYAISKNVALFGVYHYLNTNFQNITYNSNVGVAGFKYIGTYFDLQGDFDWGYMIDRNLIQYNVQLLFYPFGNLNFYTISRYSYHNQNAAGQTIFTQSAGFKTLKNTWLETAFSFGNMDNYIDTDGLYIYNTIDATKLKLGETVFYQAGKHAQLQVNYTFEKKDDDRHQINYNQHSITAGILWEF